MNKYSPKDFIGKLDEIDKIIQHIIQQVDNSSFPAHLYSPIFQASHFDFILLKHTINNVSNIFSIEQNEIFSQTTFFPNDIIDIINIMYDKIIKITKIYTDNKPNMNNELSISMRDLFEAKTRCDKYLLTIVNDIFFQYEKNVMSSIKDNDTLFKRIAVMQTKTDELEDRVKKLDSNIFKAGLAISFKNRVDGMKNEIYFWLAVTIVFIFLIPCSLAIIQIFSPFDENSIAISLSFRTPIVFSIFWMAWMASKKYSYLSNIRDDYMYKYDLAMAYHGYSDEVKKLANSNDLLTLLLGGVIQNIAQSPLDKVKSGPHTPWAETISPIIEKIGKDKDKDNNIKG